MVINHVPYLDIDFICSDGTHHVRIGRRSPVAQPTKPPAQRGKVKPVRISNGNKDWRRK